MGGPQGPPHTPLPSTPTPEGHDATQVPEPPAALHTPTAQGAFESQAPPQTPEPSTPTVLSLQLATHAPVSQTTPLPQGFESLQGVLPVVEPEPLPLPLVVVDEPEPLPDDVVLLVVPVEPLVFEVVPDDELCEPVVFDVVAPDDEPCVEPLVAVVEPLELSPVVDEVLPVDVEPADVVEPDAPEVELPGSAQAPFTQMRSPLQSLSTLHVLEEPLQPASASAPSAADTTT